MVRYSYFHLPKLSQCWGLHISGMIWRQGAVGLAWWVPPVGAIAVPFPSWGFGVTTAFRNSPYKIIPKIIP